MPKKSLRLAQQYREADKEGRQFMLDGLPYDVGHLKPPTQHQFKPGNKIGKGRPKGSENVKQMMAEELESKIEIKENGRKRKLPAARVMYRQIVHAGAKGDAKTSALAFELARKHGVFAEAPSDASSPLLSPEDFQIFKRFDEMISGSVAAKKEPEDQKQ